MNYFVLLKELKNQDIAQVISFADNNLKVVKFIPDNKQVLSKKLQHDYYGLIPILTFRTIPLDDPLSLLLKRGFRHRFFIISHCDYIILVDAFGGPHNQNRIQRQCVFHSVTKWVQLQVF